MSLFPALNTSATGLNVHRLWLDAVADNIANVSTVRRTSEPAFQERQIVVAPAADTNGGAGDGAVVVGVAYGDPAGRLEYDPSNALADAQGMVRAPDVDMADQMIQMIQAQRGFQANAAAFSRAREAYEKALEIGR